MYCTVQVVYEEKAINPYSPFYRKISTSTYSRIDRMKAIIPGKCHTNLSYHRVNASKEIGSGVQSAKMQHFTGDGHSFS